MILCRASRSGISQSPQSLRWRCAKKEFQALSRTEQIQSPQFSARWMWSPQSTSASKLLATRYGDDPSAADSDDVSGDYPSVWAAGWRWYPIPAPKTRSHSHRFYPPIKELVNIAAWREAANKKEHKSKKGLDANCVWLTSPETKLYLKSISTRT